ncbi:MAG: hypothetical protein KH543_13765, partial [Clostridiaceae bacterium]|nr:hypothetical protein [Clostridiaceae bacterium]
AGEVRQKDCQEVEKLNWKKEAENDLRCYMKRKASLNNLRDQILTLRLEQESIKACTADSEPVKGGGSKTEDRWIDNIVKTKRLSLAYSATRRIVALIEKGLDGITEVQKDFLTEFYIDRHDGHVERLMEKYHIETSQVYRIKDEALYYFTVTMYGIMEC